MRARATRYHTGESGGAPDPEERTYDLDDAVPWIRGHGQEEPETAPPTPRIEAGEKIVLPGGQVRKIRSVAYEYDDNERDVSTIILQLTGRWLDRGQ